MRRLVVSRRAQRELDTILRYSESTFGSVASTRYARLIEAAFRDIQTAPDGILTNGVPTVSGALRLYNIRHSVRRLPQTDRVKNPSHCVAYRFDDATVVITNLLHERMDIPNRLR